MVCWLNHVLPLVLPATPPPQLPRSGSRPLPPPLQQKTFGATLAPPGHQRRPGGHLKHFPHAVLCFRGALHVSEGTDLVHHVATLLWLHRFLSVGSGMLAKYSDIYI